MQTTIRPRRDFQGLALRRRQAARLFDQDESQAAVARRLRVSRQSVSRWYRQWQHGGRAALRGAGRAGRKPRLSARQRAQLDAALRRGAEAHGFPTPLWTLPRVAQVIRRETGVRYHPGHVWRLLRALHWTLQRPAGRAKERDEAAIRRWVTERWPAVKKTPAGGTPG
jgi:transposase